MANINHDFGALKKGARDWMQGFDKGLIALEQTTNADLYDSPAMMSRIS